MGIFSKLFRRESEEPAGRITGRKADFENISRLVDQDRWAEAVAALDRFLSLPAEHGAATKRLEALLRDPHQFSVDIQKTGRDAEGRDLAKVRLGFGGGSVPQMMALRGRFLLSAIEDRLRAATSGGVGVTSDRELHRLREIAVNHVNLCAGLFLSDADVLVPAARLCGVFGNYQGALELLRLALKLDPNNPDA